MAHILTLQSHVVYGHAGNAAAVFPMQRLGHQVSVLNLLQFSNHTGYGTWGGKGISAKELQEILQGLKNIDVLNQVDALISGYISCVEQAKIIHDLVIELKQQRPNFIYCCDPVMGDEGRGLYVKAELAAFIQSRLIHVADWITPNAFELSQLTQVSFDNAQQALEASVGLLQQAKNLKGILATSIANDKKNTGMLLTIRDSAYHCETPKYNLIPTVHGTGDITTATFVSHLLNGDSPMMAMQKSANTLHAMTQYAEKNNLKELDIISQQDCIVDPNIIHMAYAL